MESGWTSRSDTELTQKRCQTWLKRRQAPDYHRALFQSSILQRLLLDATPDALLSSATELMSTILRACIELRFTPSRSLTRQFVS